MRTQLDADFQTVTIASNAGELTFDVYGLVTVIFVTPEDTPSACNASVVQVVNGKEYEWIASEALSTSGAHLLYDQSQDNGVLLSTPQTPIRIKFNTGTNGDEYTVTLLLV